MKIIIISTSKSNQGGVERFSFYMRDGLEKQGHTVTLLGREDLSQLQSFIVSVKKKFGFEQPALGFFLGNLAQKKGFDVCITNGMLGWNINKGKIINVQHGTFACAAERIDRGKNMFKYFFRKHIWGFFEGLSARRATVCVAVSKETKQSVENYYHVKNVRVIANAIDTELFTLRNKKTCKEESGLPQDKNVILFDGRFEYAKGIEILDGFISQLPLLNTHIVIVDRPNEYLSQNKNITMRFFTQQELATIYSAADIFLLPSLHEGCSYSLLQAMGSGLPFLASPVGLVPELQHQGLFSECIVVDQSIESYIQAYQKLLQKSDQEKQILSDKLRDYIVKHHSIDVFVEKYARLITSL